MITLPMKKYSDKLVILVQHMAMLVLSLSDWLTMLKPIPSHVLSWPASVQNLSSSIIKFGGIKGIMGWPWDKYIKNNISFNYIYIRLIKYLSFSHTEVS